MCLLGAWHFEDRISLYPQEKPYKEALTAAKEPEAGSLAKFTLLSQERKKSLVWPHSHMCTAQGQEARLPQGCRNIIPHTCPRQPGPSEAGGAAYKSSWPPGQQVT